jgi:hypothetical protein
MAIVFDCPQHCGEELEAPESLIGESGPCPDCRKAITIPAVSKRKTEQPRTHVGVEGKRSDKY